MRPRGTLLTRTNKNLYRCFCCFHVRSGALALGSWHLMIHLFAICLLAYMSANMDDINAAVARGDGQLQSQTLTIYIKRANFSDSLKENKKISLVKDDDIEDDSENHDSSDSGDSDGGDSDEPVALPVSMKNPSDSGSSSGGSGMQLKNAADGKLFSSGSNIIIRSGASAPSVGSSGVSYYWSSFIFNSAGQPILTQRDLNLAFLLGCITVSIALMMVVGIIKGRPAYLIPFLTYQIMDLVISCLTVAGFICYGPELKDFMLSDSDFPFREEVASLDNQWVTLIIAIIILSVVFVKAYFVQVVWLCIRYLKEEKMRRAREDCQPKVIYLDNATDPELTMFMFDHEGNVVKSKVPPPAYDAAMEMDGKKQGEEDGDNSSIGSAPPAYNVAVNPSSVSA
jgi:hypothetical protein